MHFLIVDIRKRVGNLETPQYAVRRISDVLTSKDIPVTLAHYDDIAVSMKDGTLTITVLGKPLESFTHVIMRGHRTHYEYMLKQYIAAYAETHNVRVQNAEMIKFLSHYTKLNQLNIIAEAQLPYIDSYYCIDGRYWEKKEALASIGFPMVYKHTEGIYRIDVIDGKHKTKKNVYLVNDKGELEQECIRRDNPEELFTLKPSMYFIQKYINSGEDYRAVMLNGKLISAWKRVANRSFLTVGAGSEYSRYNNPDKKFVEIAVKTARTFKAEYCAVDMMFVKNTPYVVEINMNPGFKALETKVKDNTVDVAQSIVESMLAAPQPL